MSKNYNIALQTNNSSLEEIITQLNNMPDAGCSEIVLQDKTVTPTTNQQTITADSDYDGLGTVTVNAMPTATQATPTISIDSAGKITASATQSEGYVSSGIKTDTKQLTTQAAKTVTPTASNQTAVASGVYTTGAITVKGDANLKAENIKSGVSIFGVTGTHAGESGGGSSPSNPTASQNEVNFYDYDGSLLYSYTVEEAQALTSLPPLPTQPGLICQGWNYDLETIKSYNRAVDVGATYITDDGKTRLYIKIAAKGRMTVPLYFAQTVSNGVTIDWGDGSSTQTLSGTGNVNTSHTYAEIGDYVIALEVTSGTLGLGCVEELDEGLLPLYWCIMGLVDIEGVGNNEEVYCNMLQKVKIGSGVTSIGEYAFSGCFSLSDIVIPNSVTSINDRAFWNCYSLNNIIIPDGVTSINDRAFWNCYSLNNIIIPNSVTSIGEYAFYDCFSLNNIIIPNSVTSISSRIFIRCWSLSSMTVPNSVTSINVAAFSTCLGMAIYDFSSHTSVPTLADTNAFYNIPSDCIIKVPAALYDEWIAATNWSTYASYIVAV